jgi:hypothetical protein
MTWRASVSYRVARSDFALYPQLFNPGHEFLLRQNERHPLIAELSEPSMIEERW